MTRTRNIFQVEALFVGPSPASGMNHLTTDGVLNNNLNIGTFGTPNFNLIQNIPRVQSVSYSVLVERHDIAELGKRSNIHRRIRPTPITLNFEYLQNSILPELR